MSRFKKPSFLKVFDREDDGNIPVDSVLNQKRIFVARTSPKRHRTSLKVSELSEEELLPTVLMSSFSLSALMDQQSSLAAPPTTVPLSPNSLCSRTDHRPLRKPSLLPARGLIDSDSEDDDVVCHRKYGNTLARDNVNLTKMGNLTVEGNQLIDSMEKKEFESSYISRHRYQSDKKEGNDRDESERSSGLDDSTRHSGHGGNNNSKYARRRSQQRRLSNQFRSETLPGTKTIVEDDVMSLAMEDLIHMVEADKCSSGDENDDSNKGDDSQPCRFNSSTSKQRPLQMPALISGVKSQGSYYPQNNYENNELEQCLHPPFERSGSTDRYQQRRKSRQYAQDRLAGNVSLNESGFESRSRRRTHSADSRSKRAIVIAAAGSDGKRSEKYHKSIGSLSRSYSASVHSTQSAASTKAKNPMLASINAPNNGVDTANGTITESLEGLFDTKLQPLENFASKDISAMSAFISGKAAMSSSRLRRASRFLLNLNNKRETDPNPVTSTIPKLEANIEAAVTQVSGGEFSESFAQLTLQRLPPPVRASSAFDDVQQIRSLQFSVLGELMMINSARGEMLNNGGDDVEGTKKDKIGVSRDFGIRLQCDDSHQGNTEVNNLEFKNNNKSAGPAIDDDTRNKLTSSPKVLRTSLSPRPLQRSERTTKNRHDRDNKKSNDHDSELADDANKNSKSHKIRNRKTGSIDAGQQRRQQKHLDDTERKDVCTEKVARERMKKKHEGNVYATRKRDEKDSDSTEESSERVNLSSSLQRKVDMYNKRGRQQNSVSRVDIVDNSIGEVSVMLPKSPKREQQKLSRTTTVRTAQDLVSNVVYEGETSSPYVRVAKSPKRDSRISPEKKRIEGVLRRQTYSSHPKTESPLRNQMLMRHGKREEFLSPKSNVQSVYCLSQSPEMTDGELLKRLTTLKLPNDLGTEEKTETTVSGTINRRQSGRESRQHHSRNLDGSSSKSRHATRRQSRVDLTTQGTRSGRSPIKNVDDRVIDNGSICNHSVLPLHDKELDSVLTTSIGNKPITNPTCFSGQTLARPSMHNEEDVDNTHEIGVASENELDVCSDIEDLQQLVASDLTSMPTAGVEHSMRSEGASSPSLSQQELVNKMLKLTVESPSRKSRKNTRSVNASSRLSPKPEANSGTSSRTLPKVSHTRRRRRSSTTFSDCIDKVESTSEICWSRTSSLPTNVVKSRGRANRRASIGSISDASGHVKNNRRRSHSLVRTKDSLVAVEMVDNPVPLAPDNELSAMSNRSRRNSQTSAGPTSLLSAEANNAITIKTKDGTEQEEGNLTLYNDDIVQTTVVSPVAESLSRRLSSLFSTNLDAPAIDSEGEALEMLDVPFLSISPLVTSSRKSMAVDTKTNNNITLPAGSDTSQQANDWILEMLLENVLDHSATEKENENETSTVQHDDEPAMAGHQDSTVLSDRLAAEYDRLRSELADSRFRRDESRVAVVQLEMELAGLRERVEGLEKQLYRSSC